MDAFWASVPFHVILGLASRDSSGHTMGLARCALPGILYRSNGNKRTLIGTVYGLLSRHGRRCILACNSWPA